MQVCDPRPAIPIGLQGNIDEKEGLASAFDGRTDSKWSTQWRSPEHLPWVNISLDAAQLIWAYTIMSGNDFPARDPSAWYGL